MRLPIAHRILAKAALRGVTLAIEGDRLVYSPRDRMPGLLHDDLQSNQCEIKALLPVLRCCLAAPSHVRRYVAALLLIARREDDRSRARWIRWTWHSQVEMYLDWPMPRPLAEAAATIRLTEIVIGQKGRRGGW